MKRRITDREIRIFTFLAITGALGGWNVAFKFGLGWAIPYDVMFTIWAGSTAAFLASLFWPRENAMITWWDRLILLTPSLWFVIIWMDFNLEQFSQADELTFIVSVGILFIGVPYTIYLLLSITNREMFEVKSRRLQIGLVTVLATVYLLAFLVGNNFDSFLCCEDFTFGGDYVPADCSPYNE